ncbi:MAG: dTMP kinase [Pseudomonadota bacterium]
MKTGFFISFEGGEGSGKTTQAKILANRLRDDGYDVVKTHEPGGSPGGKILREVLLGGHAAEEGSLAEACLLNSSRREHVDLVIEPALKAGKTVVCDRYADSTRVYQGYVGGLDRDTVLGMEAIATKGLLPDVTVIIDIPMDIAETRRKTRLADKDDADDRFEKETREFHEKVREGFRTIAADEPKRCIIIDGSLDEKSVSVLIHQALMRRGLLD